MLSCFGVPQSSVFRFRLLADDQELAPEEPPDNWKSQEKTYLPDLRLIPHRHRVRKEPSDTLLDAETVQTHEF